MEVGGISKLATLIREAKQRKSIPTLSRSNDGPPQQESKKDKKPQESTKRTEEHLDEFIDEISKESMLEGDDVLSDLAFEDESIEEDNNVEQVTKKSSRRGRAARLSSDSRNNRTVFVGNSPISLMKKKLMKLFSVYGQVESIRMRSAAVSPGKFPVKVARRLKKQLIGSTVNWYVVMATADEAKASLELNGTEIDERHLRVDMATPTKDFKRTIFVGNLPFSADEEKLREVFRNCGDVESIRIVKDNRTGFGKGIAYVMFKDSSGVLFAIKQDEKLELGGRKLRISRCKSKTGKEEENERKEKKAMSLYGGVKTKKKGGHPSGNGKKKKPMKNHGQKNQQLGNRKSSWGGEKPSKKRGKMRR